MFTAGHCNVGDHFFTVNQTASVGHSTALTRSADGNVTWIFGFSEEQSEVADLSTCEYFPLGIPKRKKNPDTVFEL